VSDDLIEFLRARIAEDEAAAREMLAAAAEIADLPPVPPYEYADDEEQVEPFDHVVRWQPDRVLAECAAKRAIVEAYAEEVPDGRLSFGEDEGRGEALAYVCKALATVYADHEDYQPEWRV
jgi:hypothetical protein